MVLEARVVDGRLICEKRGCLEVMLGLVMLIW